MGLTKLEVENFKSYLGKQVIGPFDRFTCIVGSNGSGKSNLMDAISFILGLTSNHLRSENLTDLINKESKSEKAQVSIYLKNEKEEHKLTREINKKNRSTYFINEEPKSFSEFQEFLEKENILIKVKNFLVFQGDIESIAIKTPLEISRLIEEISGSIEYKKPYEEALERQNKANQDCMNALEIKKEMLNRIKEAKEGKEHEKKLKEAIQKKNEVQTQILLCELKNKTIQLSEARKTNENEEIKRNAVLENVNKAEKEISEAKMYTSKAQREYLKGEEAISSYKEEIKNLNRMIFEEEERKNKIKFQKQEKDFQISQILEKQEKRRTEIKKYENELKLLEEGFYHLLENENKFIKLYEKNQKEIEENQLLVREKTKNEQRELDDIEGKLLPVKEREKRNKELKYLISNKRMILEDSKLKKEEIKNKIKILEENKKQLQNKIKSGEDKYNKIQEEENKRKEELESVIKKLLDLKMKKQVSEKRALVIETADTLKTLFPGVHGTFLDLVKPIHKKYDVPLSVLIGGNDLSLIVEDDSVAVSCIEYIKEKKLCKMTFLPLNIIKGKEVTPSLREEGTPAYDTLKFDNKHKVAVQYVLGDSLIVSDIQKAKEISKKVKVKIVTLEGVLFHKNGLITGGGSKKSKFEENKPEDLIKKRNEISNALKKIDDAKATFSYVEIGIEKIKSIEEELEGCDIILKGEKDKIKNLEKEIKEAEEEGNIEAEERISILSEKIRKVEEEVYSSFLKKNKVEMKEFKKYLKEGTFYFEEKKNDFEKFKENLIFKISVFEKEIAFFEEQIAVLMKEVEEENVEVGNLDDSDLKNKIKKEEENLGKLKNEFEHQKMNLENKNLEFKKLLKDCEEKEKSIFTSALICERLKNEIEELLKYAYLEEIDVPLLAGEMSDYKNVLIDFSKMTGSEDLDSLNKEKEELVKKIDSLVPEIRIKSKKDDNSKFIKSNEEYERLKRESLKMREDFNHIKKLRTDVFMECFNVISNNIGRIYKELTKIDSSEGSAHLLLENSNEPYKEGVKFHVMPPRKRFREMRLLSGGEKTMAALALIFSFHSYKPSPFYIFDEIDAALDKSNISRVVEFMLSCDVQFIVISLKPSFFQHSDSLVGVYKKSGISNILTYKLS